MKKVKSKTRKKEKHLVSHTSNSQSLSNNKIINNKLLLNNTQSIIKSQNNDKLSSNNITLPNITTSHLKIFLILLISSFLFLTILLSSNVSALDNKLLCLTKGQILPYSQCNQVYDDFTCDGTSCQRCVYKLANGAYCPQSPNVCNGLGLSCSFLEGSDSEFDISPPNITVLSPLNGSIYSSSTIPLEVFFSEESDFFFRDNLGRNPAFLQLCSDCESYARERRFSEGLNDITLKARDGAGNSKEKNIQFIVDSKPPRLGRSSPTRGFASGQFSIDFTEDNPSQLLLHFGLIGNPSQTHQVNLQTECFEDRSKKICNTLASLTQFDGQEIEYFFSLRDIAGNIVESKPVKLKVDSTPPIINSVDIQKNGKFIIFTVNYNEAFLDKITYIDNSENAPREKPLCRNTQSSQNIGPNICEKRETFKDGTHQVTIMIYDQAGQSSAFALDSFFIDSKAPRLGRPAPSRGFASGIFTIDFQEDNPESLIINYGTQDNMQQSPLNINNDCVPNRNKQLCTTQVSLNEYNNQEIQYFFSLQDIAGNIAESRPVSLDVDITPPEILDISHTLNRNTGLLSAQIIEQNFDEVTYLNLNDNVPRERRLCSRLSGDLCNGRARLNQGDNEIIITAYDKAGFSSAQNYQIQGV